MRERHKFLDSKKDVNIQQNRMPLNGGLRDTLKYIQKCFPFVSLLCFQFGLSPFEKII